MAARIVWACIICGTRAEERPPRHCPKCGVSAGKFRMLVDRAPEPVAAPAPQPEEKKEEPKKEEPKELKQEALAS